MEKGEERVRLGEFRNQKIEQCNIIEGVGIGEEGANVNRQGLSHSDVVLVSPFQFPFKNGILYLMEPVN